MANLNQKTKLLKLLKGLNKDDFLEAEILTGIIDELEALKASIPEDPAPYVESVKILEKEYATVSDSVKGLSASLESAATEFQRLGKVTDERLVKISKESAQVIKDLKEELDKTKVKVLELSARGGGSKPLQIQNNGVVANARYADINLLGSGISIATANDDVKKITKLTLTSNGGVTSVSNSDGSLTISPTTGDVVASVPPLFISGLFKVETTTCNGSATTFSVTIGNGFETGKVLVKYAGTILDLTDDYTENATRTGITTTFTPVSGKKLTLYYFNVGPSVPVGNAKIRAFFGLGFPYVSVNI